MTADDRALLLRRANRMDQAGSADAIVCELFNGSCVRMSPSAYWLYREMQRGGSGEEIAEKIERRFGQRLGTEDVVRACAGLLDRVRDESQAVTKTARRRYVFRVRLIPETVVARLATRLTGLLSAPAVAIWICVVAVSATMFATASPASLGATQLNFATSIALGYLIYLVALIAHELGHAAACVRYGVPPGDIGFAIYLIFPAIYCDATRAWLLPRRQRLVVDAAGVLFEVGTGSICAAVGIVTHVPSLVFAAMMVLGNLLVVLNPLGRFDSYWMLSDALGIADLSRQRSQILRRLVRWRTTTDQAEQVPYTGLLRAFIICYSALTVFILLWFGYSAIRFVGPFFADLASNVAVLGRDIRQGRDGDAMGTLASVAPGLIILIVVAYRLGRALRSAIRKTRTVAPSPVVDTEG